MTQLRCHTLALRLVLPALAVAGCAADPEVEPSFELSVLWHPTDGGSSWDEARAGLAWTLGIVGGSPDGAHLRDLRWQSDSAHFVLDLSRGGFDPRAEQPLLDAVAPLLASEEYRLSGAVDLARVRAALVHEPWNYLRITGACASLQDWRDARQAVEPEGEWGPTRSWLTGGSRVIDLPSAVGPTQIAMSARSGSGSHLEGSFEPYPDVDTLDFMANGMPRFAIYDAKGELAASAHDDGRAGTPAACQWCHEGELHQGDPEDPGAAGFVSAELWRARTDSVRGLIDDYRDQRATGIEWYNPHAHTHGELLAREFLFPTADRLAREWQLEPAQVLTLAGQNGWTLAPDAEYPGRGPVLLREELEAWASDHLGYNGWPLVQEHRYLDANKADLSNADLRDDVGCW